MKISIILGTRPEIIKMSPLIRFAIEESLDFFIIHSGQHYSYEMDLAFLENLNLPGPKYNLNVGSGSHGKQIGEILQKAEVILSEENPDVVLVQGDTNTVLAAALAASRLGIKVGHVEAGLRSYDNRMPEEINRKLTDHISDFLFCPTEKAKENALKEGINEKKLFVTGNTIVDAVIQNKELAMKKSNALSRFVLQKRKYFLVTTHRPENVDSETNLKRIIFALDSIGREYNLPVVFPVHPRAKKMLKLYNMEIPSSILCTPPLGFLDFLQLEASAKLILTDSGGVQEESCILRVPCVTLRENTERPETVDVRSNKLAGTDSSKIIGSVGIMVDKERSWENPFGDGNSSQEIIRILENEFVREKIISKES